MHSFVPIYLTWILLNFIRVRIDVFVGDLNTTPPSQSKKYPSLAYETFKNHPLGLRSVLNDDVGSSGSKKKEEIYDD